MVSVLHELNLALAAEHLVVMDAGRVVSAAPPGAPESHEALMRVFGGRLELIPHGEVGGGGEVAGDATLGSAATLCWIYVAR